MNQIPIYLKTSPDMARPKDPEFYWITADGTFLGRNHPFFSSDVPARQAPRTLAPHRPFCRVRYPKLGVAALEYLIGFFDAVFQQHGSESIALLFWNQRRRRYKICIPKQQATVWESTWGARSAMDLHYEVPLCFAADHRLVADIHCHGDLAAYTSWTDANDEKYRDGVHAVVGQIDREPPDFHIEISIGGTRFNMQFRQLFKGYRRRRCRIPQQWLDQVTVDVRRSSASYRNDPEQGRRNSFTDSPYQGGRGDDP